MLVALLIRLVVASSRHRVIVHALSSQERGRSAVARAPTRAPTQTRSDYHKGTGREHKITKQTRRRLRRSHASALRSRASSRGVWLHLPPTEDRHGESDRHSLVRDAVDPSALQVKTLCVRTLESRERGRSAVARTPARAPAQTRSDYHKGLVEGTKAQSRPRRRLRRTHAVLRALEPHHAERNVCTAGTASINSRRGGCHLP